MIQMITLGEHVVCVSEDEMKEAGIDCFRPSFIGLRWFILLDFIRYSIADGSWSPLWHNAPNYPLVR